MPKTSEAMLKAINKYHKEKLDELKIRVPKGRKNELQSIAQSQGESLNGFVNKAIDERVERLQGDIMEYTPDENGDYNEI